VLTELFLALWFGVSMLAGLWLLANAKSAIHEIEAFLFFLMATVALGSAAVVSEIRRAFPPPTTGQVKSSGWMVAVGVAALVILALAAVPLPPWLLALFH
jgi:hypothetical protein